VDTLTTKTFVGKSFGGKTSAEKLSDKFFYFGGKTSDKNFQAEKLSDIKKFQLNTK